MLAAILVRLGTTPMVLLPPAQLVLQVNTKVPMELMVVTLVGLDITGLF